MGRCAAGLLVLGALLSTACSDAPVDPDGDDQDPNIDLSQTAALRVVHTILGVPAVDVLVDGKVVVAALPIAAASEFVNVAAGDRAVAFRPAGTAGDTPATSLSFAAGDSITVLTIDSSSIINPHVLTDSGTVVPANKSKLR